MKFKKRYGNYIINKFLKTKGKEYSNDKELEIIINYINTKFKSITKYYIWNDENKCKVKHSDNRIFYGTTATNIILEQETSDNTVWVCKSFWFEIFELLGKKELCDLTDRDEIQRIRELTRTIILKYIEKYLNLPSVGGELILEMTNVMLFNDNSYKNDFTFSSENKNTKEYGYY